MICCQFSPNVTDTKIVSGHYQGNSFFFYFLPRILFIPVEGEHHGIPFKRTRFPTIMSFATIIKAQVQTLEYVGIYLSEPVVYVA